MDENLEKWDVAPEKYYMLLGVAVWYIPALEGIPCRIAQVRSCNHRRECWLLVHNHHPHVHSSREGIREGIRETVNRDPCGCRHQMKWEREFSRKVHRRRRRERDVSCRCI